MTQSPAYVFVMGPTAAGKSGLALSFAEKLTGSEIVNCDSVQSYEKLQIGAAKPTADELSRVPHHLYSYVPLTAKQGAGEYRRSFFTLADEFTQRGMSRALVVGGTGFYFQAVEKGMFPTRPSFPEIRMAIEQELQAGDAQALYEELVLKDPKSAKRIERNDHYRIGRALEVIRGEGRSLSEIEEEFSLNQSLFPYPLLKLGVALERDQLRIRVKERVERMLDEGLVDEVKDLKAQGFDKASALQSIGYKECLIFLRENRDRDWLVSEISKNTMRLAKRQMTWFRRDADIHWVSHDQPRQVDEAFGLVSRFFDSR